MSWGQPLGTLRGLPGDHGTDGRGFTPRGAWAVGGTVYAVDDISTYNGQTYRCIQAHTANSVLRAPGGVQGATYWEMWAAKGLGYRSFQSWVAPTVDTQPVWSVNDTVPWNGSVYACVQAHTSTPAAPREPGTTDGAGYWTLWAAKGAPGTNGADSTVPGPTGPAGLNWRNEGWQPNTPYAVNDAFSYQGSSYRVTRAHTSGATFSLTSAALLLRNEVVNPRPTALATTNNTWTTFSGNGEAAPLTVSSTDGPSGYSLLRTVSTAASAVGIARGVYTVSAPMSSAILANRSLRFLVRAQVKPTVGRTFRVGLGNPGSSEVTTAWSTPTNCPSGVWTPVQGVLTIPSGTTTARLYVTEYVKTIGPVGEVDAFSAFQVVALPADYTGDGSDIPYFDGATLGTWTGAADNSASTYGVPGPAVLSVLASGSSSAGGSSQDSNSVYALMGVYN